MKRTTSLPTFNECEKANEAGHATVLQQFIYENEPQGLRDELDFRDKLLAVIQQVEEDFYQNLHSRDL